MRTYTLSHLSDPTLARDLPAVAMRNRGSTVELLMHLAEFDARKLFRPAGYESMYEYCVDLLRFSEDEACDRIKAARLARQFPAIFQMIADGSLNLTGLLFLAPYLTAMNCDELLAAAAGKRKQGIQEVVAARFPRTEPLPMVVQVRSHGVAASVPQRMVTALVPVPERITSNASETVSATLAESSVPSRAIEVSRATPDAPSLVHPRPKLTPIAQERYALQFSIGKSAHDNLRLAQELLGHAVPSGDIAQVFERALEALVRELEKRKFAATSRPRSPRPRSSVNPRYIPAHVKRAVRARDQRRCTFVSEDGHRCTARRGLEFDHVEPVALGGGATVANIRLRCRAHNQLEVERAFGAGFMSRKREIAAAAGASVAPA